MIPKLESRRVRVGEINTHYLVCGEGPSLVLISGGGATTAEKDWSANLEALSLHYRVYAPDLVGFGKTDKPDADYTFSFFNQFFEDFARVLELEHMHLIGHSLGGGIALAFTLSHPDRVGKVILIDSSGLSNDTTLLGKTLIILFKMVARLQKNRTCVSFLNGGSSREAHEIFMDRLSEIRSPTLICWGQWDGYLPVKLAYQAHKRIEGSQLHIFKRGWHAPHKERAEEFNRLALDFLRTQK